MAKITNARVDTPMSRFDVEETSSFRRTFDLVNDLSRHFLKGEEVSNVKA